MASPSADRDPLNSYIPRSDPLTRTANAMEWTWMAEPARVWPDAPRTIADCGISATFLADLLIKTLHYGGPLTAEMLCTRSGLPFEVVDDLVTVLKTDYTVDVVAGSQYGELGYKYRLTDRGEQHALDAIARSSYASVAPVTLDQYTDVVRKQSLRETPPSTGRIMDALGQFVLSQPTVDGLARALHSGRATLIFGASGNGKTAVIEHYARHADDTVIIPYALYVHGQLIRIFDPTMHVRADSPAESTQDAGIFKASVQRNRLDQRWVRVHRPVVVVGGELTQESLELSLDPVARFYQAPPHLKAQDGVFVVDDFGRQRVRPEELLNRWILPMERGSDILSLHSGESVTVPFEIALMFSTNLAPADLVDEAFLRRIPYKVNLPSPDREQFKEISRRICIAKRITFNDDALDYVVARLFHPSFPFEPRGAHPRDLVQIIMDSARFDGTEPTLTPESIERAIAVYFIE